MIQCKSSSLQYLILFSVQTLSFFFCSLSFVTCPLYFWNDFFFSMTDEHNCIPLTHNVDWSFYFLYFWHASVFRIYVCKNNLLFHDGFQCFLLQIWIFRDIILLIFEFQSNSFRLKILMMDNDDESLGYFPSSIMTTTVAPDHFLLSTYRENGPSSADYSSDSPNRTCYSNQHGSRRLNPLSNYKCCLCRKIADDGKVICATCVNTGRFCSSKHNTCSNVRRQALVNMLSPMNQEEFHQFSSKLSINTPPHLQYEWKFSKNALYSYCFEFVF